MPVNRARIAERADARPLASAHGTLGTNPALRFDAIKAPVGHVCRTRTASVGGSGSKGYQSEWNAAPTYWCPIEVDRRWSK